MTRRVQLTLNHVLYIFDNESRLVLYTVDNGSRLVLSCPFCDDRPDQVHAMAQTCLLRSACSVPADEICKSI